MLRVDWPRDWTSDLMIGDDVALGDVFVKDSIDDVRSAGSIPNIIGQDADDGPRFTDI